MTVCGNFDGGVPTSWQTGMAIGLVATAVGDTLYRPERVATGHGFEQSNSLLAAPEICDEAQLDDDGLRRHDHRECGCTSSRHVSIWHVR